MYLISQNKKSISALELSRHCGIGYTSACLIKQKIIHAFLQAEQYNPLAGVVHINDGYLGGKRQGIRGRGAHGKTTFITEISLVNGRPTQLKLSIVPVLLDPVSVIGRKQHYQDRAGCTQMAYRGLQGSSRIKSYIRLLI